MSLFLKLLEDEGRSLGQAFLAGQTTARRMLPNMENNIKCGNSLVGKDFQNDLLFASKKEYYAVNPFDWREAFPQIFANGGFDCVVGNPPYVSAPSQIALHSLAMQRDYLSKCPRFKTLVQKWDLYVPFMELGLNILKDNGAFGMIVPFPLTNQLYGKKLRDLMTNSYNLFEISDLQGVKVFATATVTNCIPFVRKAAPQESVDISTYSPEKQTLSVAFAKPLADLVQDEKKSVWNLTQEKRKTNRHSDMHVLGDFCYVSKGMVLNADKKTAMGEFKKEDLISETPDEIHSRKYIEAKNIERYAVKRERYLEWNTPRCPGQLSRPTFRELYEYDRLIMNCLGTINATTDCGEQYLHNHSIYCAIPWNNLREVDNKSISGNVKKFSSMTRRKMEALSGKVNLKYLLGVMNSRYAGALLSNLRGDDYHIYPEHIRNIPIPLATPAEQKAIADLVEKMLATQRELQGAATPSGRNFLEQKAAALDRQINQAVYQLYNLTPAEIAVVEGRPA